VIPFKYRPDIDGLRAVAVLLVLFFHTDFGFSGGYVGVDVFFVISGFLITGLIVKNQQKDQFSLATFWGRRIRRIVPAAFVVVVVTLLAGAWILLPADYEQLAESTIYQQLMLANDFFYRNLNYFDGPSETKALLHTWSLAVEEQFYLAFPLLLIFLRRFSARTSAITLSILALLSFSYSQWAVASQPSAAFFLLPSRMWELLIGAILVFVPAPNPASSRKVRFCCEWMGFLGLGGIVASGILFNSSTPFPGMAALLPCVATAFVIYSNVHCLTTAGKILSNQSMIFIGLISYSLYLWHWPILALAHYHFGHTLTFTTQITALLLSFFCAWLSWRFIETPFRQGFKKTTLPRTVAITIACATLLISVSVWIDHTKGLSWRLPSHVYQLIQDNDVPKRFRCTTEQVRSGELPVLGIRPSAGEPVDFIVWGDSHAMATGTLFEILATEYQQHGRMAARSAIAPLIQTWRTSTHREAPRWNDEVLQFIQQHNVPHVFLISRWAVGIEGRPDGDLSSLISNEHTELRSRRDARQVFQQQLQQTLQELSQAGTHVWIIQQVPLQKSNPEHLVVRAALANMGIPTGVSLTTHQQRQEHANRIIHQVAATMPNVTVLDPARVCFDTNEQSILGDQQGVFYADDDHLSPHGAEILLRPLLEPVFKAFGEPNDE